MTRFDLVREGARRDGVEIVHYQPRFPVPGTRAERRVERVIGLLFTISGLGWWPKAAMRLEASRKCCLPDGGGVPPARRRRRS